MHPDDSHRTGNSLHSITRRPLSVFPPIEEIRPAAQNSRMEPTARKLVGFHVSAPRHDRTLRLDLLLEQDEVLNIELPLATATRLTNHLVEVEFRERCLPPDAA
jgi:hypothetical protein